MKRIRLIKAIHSKEQITNIQSLIHIMLGIAAIIAAKFSAPLAFILLCTAIFLSFLRNHSIQIVDKK